MKCSSCGFENEPDVKFCGNCGAKLSEKDDEAGKKLFCPNCGQENPPDSRFCQNCGKDMTLPAPATPPSPVLQPVTGPVPVPPPVSQPAAESAPLPRPARKRMPGWVWGVLGVLVVLLGVGAVLSLSRSKPVATESPPTQAPQAKESTCEDKLAFVTDVTVPDGTILSPDELFTKTWRIRNTGTCTWTTSYQLVFKDGQQMSAPEAVTLTRDVPAGQEVDISVDFTAPSDMRPYKSFWQLQNADGTVVPIEGVEDNSIFVDITVGDQNVLLWDDFDDPSSGWSIFGGKNERSEVGYENGNYRFAFHSLQCGFDAGWSPEQYGDAVVETLFSTPADVPDVGAGFTLRTTEGKWYLLWVYPAQGKYLFQKDINGQVTELVSLTESPVIRPLERDGRLFLQLKVEARGDRFDIWVGPPDSAFAFLKSVSDAELKTGHLGPSADCPDSAYEPPIEVLFEWIKISK